MVHAVEHQPLDGGVEGAEVGGHAREGIAPPLHRHLDQVIVPVRAIALAVEVGVLLGGERGALESVTGAEVVLPRELERAHAPKYST